MRAIYHHFFDTRFGKAALTFTHAPFHLLEVCLPRRRKADVIACMKTHRNGHEYAPPEAIEIAATVNDYFGGGSWTIPWQCMDTRRWTPAQADIYLAVAQIPYGTVRSYGQVARHAGRPKAARFVGNCMAANPFPVFVPCHRVIAGDGRPGGFGGGVELKLKMLELEGLTLKSGKITSN